jgi:hypothetical protein
MKTDLAIELGAATLLDGDMPARMRVIREARAAAEAHSAAFDDAERPVFEPLERAWRLGGAAHVFARKDSVLPEAIDRVFGAMAVNALERRAERVLSLDARPVDGGALRIYANGLPIVRVRADEELAPTLEGTIAGFAVRTRDDAAAFHAASLEIDGRGVMLPGQKGSGKSTLALALALERTATYLGDELAFIRFDDRRMEAFPKAVTLKEGSFSLFPEADTFRDPLRGPVRYHHPENCAPAGHIVDLDLIVFPRYVPEAEEPCATEVEPAQTAFELIRHCFGGLERDPRTMSSIAAISRVPAFEITFSDPAAAGRAIRAILGGLSSFGKTGSAPSNVDVV